MILVDTSVWIDLLRSKPRIEEEDLFRFAVCGPIVQEVLQGLKPGAASDAFRTCFLALAVLSGPIQLELYVAAADMYRSGRRRGLTIRSSVDCFIAAIAIENRVPVWRKDRDFAEIATFTELAVV